MVTEGCCACIEARLVMGALDQFVVQFTYLRRQAGKVYLVLLRHHDAVLELC